MFKGLTIVAALLSAASAQAAVVLDQDNLMTLPGIGSPTYSGTIGTATDYRQAQVVRAGVTGYLDHIDLQIRRPGNVTGALDVELIYASNFTQLPTTVGVPAATIAAASIPTSVSGAVISVDVRSANFFVSPGVKFAILLRADTPGNLSRYGWLFGELDDNGNTVFTRDYPGGQNNLFNVYGPDEWGVSGLDRGFATYVDVTGTQVPEPASWALLIAGFGLAGAAARRRRVLA